MTMASARRARIVNVVAIVAAALVVLAVAVALLTIRPPSPTAQQRMHLVRVVPESAEGLVLTADEQTAILTAQGLTPAWSDADFSSGTIPSTVDPAECATDPVTPVESGVSTFAKDADELGVTLGSFSIVFATPDAARDHLDWIVRSRGGACASMTYQDVSVEGDISREYTVDTARYEDPADGIPQVVLESTVRYSDGAVYDHRAVFDQLGNAIVVVYLFENQEIGMDASWADEAFATVHDRVIAQLTAEAGDDLHARS